MGSGDVTLGGLRRFNTVTVQNLTVTGTLTTTGGISDGSSITLADGKALQSDTTTGHTAVLAAYDVDGTAYKNFATLTNGNTPSFAIAAPSGGTVTIDGAVIGGTTAASGSFTTVNVAGSSSGNTTIAALASASGTLTLPAATDTLVGKSTTDVLSNKTLGSAAGTAVTMVDGGDIAIGSGIGTKIGSAAGSKIGFWGVPPVVQQSLTSFAAAATTAVTTAAGIYGFTTAAQAAGIVSLLNQIRAILIAEGHAVGP